MSVLWFGHRWQHLCWFQMADIGVHVPVLAPCAHVPQVRLGVGQLVFRLLCSRADVNYLAPLTCRVIDDMPGRWIRIRVHLLYSYPNKPLCAALNWRQTRLCYFRVRYNSCTLHWKGSEMIPMKMDTLYAV